jgi:predicted ATPase/class 3 adenylate cyclase
MPFCNKCGKDNATDARFCSACGTLLAEIPAPPEARKTVTVVFCDLTGSTSMGERLDPESVRGVMSRYYAEMRAVLERHGGTVEKFVGDAVLAVFGIPTLHEDDALRAVRAAVDMRDALSALNDELEQRWGVRLQVRTGVNTGKVVAGDPTQGQTFVVGDAVNVAARLEQTAGPGEILIGKETFRLVRDAVTAKEVAPLTLKGKAEPFPALKLIAVSPRRRGLDRRLDSPVVGREPELEMLREAFERAVQGRSCELCTVVGSAGIGKSRLTEEFVGSLEGRARVLRGRCLPYGEGITYWPIAEIVRQVAGLAEDESVTDARAKVAALLSRDEDADQIVERVGTALGFSEGASSTEETFWGVRRLLEALSADLPLVVVFDDIHWGEETFLDLLEHLGRRSRGHSILVLCLARSELRESHPDFGNAVDCATTLALEALDASESRRLIANLVGDGGLARELAQRVGDHASGNPLYVGEMIRMLVDEGLLQKENGRWRARGESSTLSVPPTIEALLAARLDQLAQQERAMLERASVIGEEFWAGAVLELAPEIEREAADALLESLLGKDLIRGHQATFAGEAAYRFTHLLVRDVAYDGLLKETRSELHERFAEWLRSKVGQRISEYEEIVGYHLERSYGYRTEIGTIDEPARAVGTMAAEHLGSAGWRAFARGDLSAAASLLTRAHALLPENDLVRLALQIDLAEVLLQAGELPRADRLLAETIATAERQHARGLESRSRIIYLTLKLFTDPDGKVEEALEELHRAIPVLEELGEERALAKAWRLKAELHAFALRLGEVETAGERALYYARRSGDEPERHEIQSLLTLALQLGPTPVPVVIARLEALLDETSDDPRGKAYASGVLGLMNAMVGNFEEARRLGAIARRICEELEWRFLLGAGVPQVDGTIELLAGDPEAAEHVIRPGYEMLVEMGEKSNFSTVAAMLAEALYRQGNDEEAERFTVASEEAAAFEDIAAQVEWRSTRAKVFARRGQLAEAESLANEALALARGTDSPTLQGDALMDLAEVLRFADRPADAEPSVREAIALYEAKGILVSARRASALLEELSAIRG